MKVISTGEKIKKLRLDIGLNQEDLTNDEITRSLISMIENNKRKLTYKTASVIAAILNQYYQNLGKEITPDYLLETESQQAERLIKERLNEMKQLLEHPVPGNESAMEATLEGLIDFAKEWQLEAMEAELLAARGRLYYSTNRYNECLNPFFKALEYYVRVGEYGRISACYNFIGMAYYQLMLYGQAINYYQQSEEVLSRYAPEELERVKTHMIHNKILCYQKLKQYDMVLKEIAVYKALENCPKEQQLSVLLIEGNTYRDLGNLEKAIKIYDRLITKHQKHLGDMRLLVYSNYAHALHRKGDYGESLKYIEIALQYKDESRPMDTVDLLLDSAQIHLSLGALVEAQQYANQAVLMAEQVNNIHLRIKAQLLLAKILIEREQFSVVERQLKGLEALILDSGMDDRLMDLHIHYLLLYSKMKAYERCQEHIQCLYQFRKERE